MTVPVVPGAINVPAPLTGEEIIGFANLGPQDAQTTTKAIAALAFSGGSFINGGTIKVTSGTAPLIISGNTGTPVAAGQATDLQIIGTDGGIASTMLESHGGTPFYSTRRSSGTLDAPTAVEAGDAIGGLRSYAYGSTTYSTASRAAFQHFASETWTDAAQGTYSTWRTTVTGGLSTAERMRLQNGGALTIGTTADDGTNKLQVNGGITGTGLDQFSAAGLNIAGASSKLGFYTKAPVALQTGVAVSAAGIHAALVNLGLITA